MTDEQPPERQPADLGPTATSGSEAGGSSADDRPDYKGAPLDAERGPGLGCFWVQVVAFGVLFVLIPYGVVNAWPAALTTAMLIALLVLALFVGQTVIFLLRLVSADRRSRRRPLREGARPTVGDLAAGAPDAPDLVEASAGADAESPPPPEAPPPPSVRQ